MDGSGRKVLKNAMNAVVQQPDPTRRRLLQFSAGASAQVFLPGVPLSPVSIATEMAAPAVIAVSENAATFMAMALSHSTYMLHTRDDLLGIETRRTPHDNTYQIRNRRWQADNHMWRIEDVFSFYTIFGESSLLVAQKTQGWAIELMNGVNHRKKAYQDPKAISEIKKYPDSYTEYTYNQEFFKDDVVTEKSLLRGIFDLIEKILDHDQWCRDTNNPEQCAYGRSKILKSDLDYELRSKLARSVYYSKEDSVLDYDDLDTKIAALTDRQKIEILLETSRFDFGAYSTILKSKNAGWFDVSDYFARRIAEESSGISRVEEYAREFPDLFSAQEYFERRDRFVTEMDLFFARREMKKRLEMKQAHAEQKGAEPPVPLLRGVAAVRGTFSKLGGHVSGFLRTAFTEKTKDIIDPVVQPDEPSAPLSLGYQPVSDGIGTIDLSGLQHASEAESIKRTPPQP